ncbi:MAG: hypothetical protein AAF514_21810, partial [Verrucomicrobiota bacterium]
MDWLQNHQSSLNQSQAQEALTILIGTWSDKEPAAAADYLLTLSEANTFKSAARQVMRDWAGKNLDEAAAWIAAVDDPNQQKHLEVLLAEGALTSGNRDEGIAYARSRYGINDWMSHTLYLLVSQGVGDDIEGSVVWIREVAPDERILEEFTNTLLHQWRGRDISEAVKHLDLMPDPIRRAEDYE